MDKSNDAPLYEDSLRFRLKYPIRLVSRRRCFLRTSQHHHTNSIYYNALIAIAQGIAWRKLLIMGAYRSLCELAKAMETDVRYARRKILLASLSPEIIRLLQESARRPNSPALHDVTLVKLMTIAELPWPEQHKHLGIA